MARSLVWQDAATDRSTAIRVHEAAAALGKPRRPGADGHYFQPPVVAKSLHHRAKGIDMANDGAVGRTARALEIRPDGAAARKFIRYLQCFQLRADIGHNGIRHAAGARDRQHRLQRLQQVIAIDR